MLETDRQLVIQARTGDRQAFATLVRRYERPVLAVAMAVLRSPEDARDVAQESFVVAYRKLNHLWVPARFGPWVLKIARRLALRYRKLRDRRSCEPLPAEWAGATEAMANSDEPDRMLDCIARLPAHERLVVMLRYLDGLETPEIARVTGRPLGTVTKQLSRAHRRLREWLEQEVDHEPARTTF